MFFNYDGDAEELTAALGQVYRPGATAQVRTHNLIRATMPTSIAFEITEEDVANVLVSHWFAVANTNGKSFAAMAAEMLPKLDSARIERAALEGDHIEEQTTLAHAEIARQLRERGVLEQLVAPDDSALTHLQANLRP